MAKRIEAIGNDIARLQGARLVTAIEIMRDKGSLRH